MKPKRKTNETIKAVLLAIFAALILRQFVIAAYKIPTGSMENTLLVGDFLLVNKFVYGARTPDWIGIPGTSAGFELPEFSFPAIAEPHPSDIVVFKYPKDPRLDYIKRCVAVGGEVVESKNKRVLVNGHPFHSPPKLKFIDRNIYNRLYKDPEFFRPRFGNRDNFGPIMVPPNHYFMMGDNRDNSLDSRYWGFVPPENIVGRPLIVYLSWDGDSDNGLLGKVRWNRLGKVVK